MEIDGRSGYGALPIWFRVLFVLPVDTVLAVAIIVTWFFKSVLGTCSTAGRLLVGLSRYAVQRARA